MNSDETDHHPEHAGALQAQPARYPPDRESTTAGQRVHHPPNPNPPDRETTTAGQRVHHPWRKKTTPVRHVEGPEGPFSCSGGALANSFERRASKVWFLLASHHPQVLSELNSYSHECAVMAVVIDALAARREHTGATPAADMDWEDGAVPMDEQAHLPKMATRPSTSLIWQLARAPP